MCHLFMLFFTLIFALQGPSQYVAHKTYTLLTNRHFHPIHPFFTHTCPVLVSLCGSVLWIVLLKAVTLVHMYFYLSIVVADNINDRQALP